MGFLALALRACFHTMEASKSLDSLSCRGPVVHSQCSLCTRLPFLWGWGCREGGTSQVSLVTPALAPASLPHPRLLEEKAELFPAWVGLKGITSVQRAGAQHLSVRSCVDCVLLMVSNAASSQGRSVPAQGPMKTVHVVVLKTLSHFFLL